MNQARHVRCEKRQDIVGEIDGRKLGKIKKCNTTYST